MRHTSSNVPMLKRIVFRKSGSRNHAPPYSFISSNNMPINPRRKTISSPNTILAIDPSTRDLGIAIFVDDDLAYYTLKTIRPRHPRRARLQTVSEVIERLIRDFEPSTLAIEHVPLVQKSEALLSVVADEIRITAASAGLVVKEYDPRQVRSRICESFE